MNPVHSGEIGNSEESDDHFVEVCKNNIEGKRSKVKKNLKN